MSEGIGAELRGIDLGDQRLNKRSERVLERLAANCEVSVNAAMNGWAETQAAYRLFDNPLVTPEKILTPHFAATLRRVAGQAMVIVIQDSSALNFSDHPADDQQCLCDPTQLGFYEHPNLVLTPDGLPLGLVALEFFDRSAESLIRKRERKKNGEPKERRTHDPIETKESYRWFRGFQAAGELARKCPETIVVSAADREADIYDIFVEAMEARQTTPNLHLVIRAYEDRSTLELDLSKSRRTYHKVRDVVAMSPVRMTREVALPATAKRSARRAIVEVRALEVQIKPPNARPHLPTVTLNVVLVEEVNCPEPSTAISWLLVTTMPIATLGDLLSVLDTYSQRWGVEIFFHVLKSGCRVEELRLETKSRQQNCLAFYNIIAWRILYLTYLNRECPQMSCEGVFADHEWKPVWRVVTKKPLPPNPPTMKEFMKLLAQLGGYNNRPKEAPAGPLPIWIGMRRMLDYSVAWLAFGPGAERPHDT